MKKILIALAALFLSIAPAVRAQTTVSATVTDSSSVVWANCTWTATYVYDPKQGTPTSGGQFFTTTFSGTCDGSGAFSQSLTSTNTILPAPNPPAQGWQFVICPQNSIGACGTVAPIAVTGGSLNISSNITAVIRPPQISPGVLAQGYADSEIANPRGGYQYFRLSDNTFRCYTTSWGACANTVSAGVSSLNTLTGALTLAAGSNVTITPSGGNTLTIASTGGSNPGGTTGQIQWNNGGVLGGFTTSGDATINTSTGALTLANIGAPVGTCGDATHIPQVTLNAKGLATACTPIAISGGSAFSAITSGTNTTAAMVVGSGASLSPTGSGTITANLLTPDPYTQGGITLEFTNGIVDANDFVGGAFSGDCSACSNISAVNISSGLLAIARGGTGNGTAPSSGQIEVAQSGTAYNPKTMSGDATLAASGALTLATVNSNTGVCGDATHVCQVTLNGKGLATAASAVAITALSNPMTTLGDMIDGGASGAPTRVVGPTVGTVPYNLISIPSGGAATHVAWGLAGVPGRTVTGTTDTVAATDRGNIIGFTSASAVAETFTSPATLGNNFSAGLHNLAAGIVTATLGAGNFATTGTSTKALANGEWCAVSSSDNTNIDDRCSSGLTTAGTGITVTHSATGVSISLTATPVTSVTGTSPIVSSGGATPAISCATCVTSAASLTNNALMAGAGSQGSQTITTGTGVLTALGVNTGSAGAFGVLIASGTSAMGTGAITSGTCATVVTTTATGVATTDTIIATPNTDPTVVTGYAVSATGSLYIQAFPSANNVNFKVCNPSNGSLTPAALTMNWRVIR